MNIKEFFRGMTAKRNFEREESVLNDQIDVLEKQEAGLVSQLNKQTELQKKEQAFREKQQAIENQAFRVHGCRICGFDYDDNQTLVCDGVLRDINGNINNCDNYFHTFCSILYNPSRELKDCRVCTTTLAN